MLLARPVTIGRLKETTKQHTCGIGRPKSTAISTTPVHRYIQVMDCVKLHLWQPAAALLEQEYPGAVDCTGRGEAAHYSFTPQLWDAARCPQ